MTPIPSPQLQRLALHVPTEYVTRTRASFGEGGQKALLADLAQRLKGIGYREVLAVMQDPTDPAIFTAIARGDGSQQALGGDNVVRITRADAVETTSLPDAATSKTTPVRFDDGMSPEEDAVLRRALAGETNVRHLDGHATSFEPCFPTSASLLRCKAMLLELRAERHLREASKENTNGETEGSAGPHPPTGDTLADLTRSCTDGSWPEVETMWRQYGQASPTTWRQGPTPTAENAAAARAILADHEKKTGTPNEMLRDEVRKAALRIAGEPFDRLFFDTRAPRDLVHAAASACVVEVGLGVRVVCPQRIRLVLPPDPRDGFVSPSALQLALATMKPGISRVRDVRRIERVFGGVMDASKDKTPEDKRNRLRAQTQLMRAQSAIERRRWIEWHRRTQDVEEGKR